jgi:hypothetical protein
MAQLDRQRHPFYEHSDAAFFLAQEGERVVGRIAVLENSRYNTYHGERAAFFYFFDAINDTLISRGLFGAAADWARGRGLQTVWGPKGFLASDGQGILIEGFEHRAAMGIPFNHPYYGELVEDAGFVRKLDFVSLYMDRQYEFPTRFLRVAEKIKRRRGFRSMHFKTKAELRAVVTKVTAVYNEAFAEVVGYVPITEKEAQIIGERILAVADPSLVSLLMRGEDIIGFVLAYPDLSAAIQRCRGRMWPLGWYHLLREFKRTRWINFNGAGIRAEYRGLGGNALLYAELYRILIQHPQYDFADLIQVQEPNTRMMQELEAMGVKPRKRHRTYEQSLG